MKDVTSLLMTYDEYSRTAHESPYLYELCAGESYVLDYIGVEHVYHADTKLRACIADHFVTNKPAAAVIEGISFLCGELSTSERFRRMEVLAAGGRVVGELGLLLMEALAHHCPLFCFEPGLSEEVAALEASGFERRFLFAFYGVRQLDFLARSVARDRVEAALVQFLEMFAEATRWPEFEYSVAHLDSVSRELFGGAVPRDSAAQFLGPRIAPVINPSTGVAATVLNEISRASSDVRDRAIVHGIQKLVTECKRVLVVYGVAHAVRQERALRVFFEGGV